MNQSVLVEVCTASVQGAIDAQDAGADRIELNYALELDGLTPGAGLLDLVLSQVRIPVIAMARPRGGNFHYSDLEWETLVHDARHMLNRGVHGIAFGCLNATGQIDPERCHEMRRLAGGREIVFHKAFDEVANWESGLTTLIEAGVNRVMTSGLESTANEGIQTISQIVEWAAGRIEVLPAGGVSSENAEKIVKTTGAGQIHGSFASGGKAGIPEEIRRTIAALESRSN